jgi:YVTN family beta-propeller protein
MVYGTNPISEINIRRGWVLASRIARVRLDGPARREAISLDPKGQAIADPHGLAISKDEQWIVATASGSQELLVYRLPGLPFQDYGGPGDHIDAKLLADADRFFRIPLGGRPMGVRLSPDGRRAYVANYLGNSVQIIDLEARKVARTIDLGHAEQPSLARRGEAIFYDGRRSLDQWYSCHSCHYEGGTNAVSVDTLNDGSPNTYKTVLELYNLEHTAPWTWHGWQTDLRAAMRKSLTETMRGPEPTEEDISALLAFCQGLERAPNSHLGPNGELSEAAQRGKQIFASDKAGCANCHSGEYLTDGQVHDLGLATEYDRYRDSNTPSLLGVGQRVALMHDGRAAGLEELLDGPHNPAKVTGEGELTAVERRDLIEYLRSL